MLSLAALSDPTRQRIIELLARGSKSSGEIARQFPLTAPAISQHLRTLREAKLVRMRPVAQRRIYELDPRGIEELSTWLDEIRQFWSGKLAVLEEQLRKGQHDE